MDVSYFLSDLFIGSECALMLSSDGFFDAGMLLQALKARGEALDDTSKPSERATVHARRREIGKRLRLSEY